MTKGVSSIHTSSEAREKAKALKRIAEQIALQLPDHRADALMVLEYTKEILDWRTSALGEVSNNVFKLGALAACLLVAFHLQDADALADGDWQIRGHLAGIKPVQVD